MKNYNYKKIEKKWQEEWEKSGIYQDYSREKKFYALDMFPYPSGAGLHVGHPKGYTATDVYSRFMMLNGYSVLHPMGWDAFGLPAENYAIKNKVHPREAVEKNIKVFKKQLSKFGFTYDWEREVNTTDPEYYKWTQWIFLQMFKHGLAYQSDEPVNWCPSCKTVLANEDLENGNCERCGAQVEQKKLKQWVLKMTAYADRLLYDLDREDLDWEEMIKEQQRNWIGRSEGVEFKLAIAGMDESISVYTTRVDTSFGMTYAVVAPEHPLIEKLRDKIENYAEIEAYVKNANKKTELERTELQKEKTGVELKGIRAINPFTEDEIPLFVADYVIGHYGTGAVMAVPAHDERDFEFAKKKNITIKKVIKKSKEDSESNAVDEAFTQDGILFNSGEFSGLASKDAREKMAEWLEQKDIGKKKVNYKMRDWVFSRQRYWGEPIPIIHCPKCGAVPVDEKDLPLTLPEVEKYEPTGTGESPLAGIDDWVNTKCSKCGGNAKRETNTMPQWAGSCWYYLRYIDNKNNQALVDKNKEREWMPVDLYVGGAEHATRHLLYARFWHKFLFDIGVVSTNEPFKRLVHVGLINAEDGRKMSKSLGNVVNPDDMIDKFGADAFRIYEMFMGPFTQAIAWNTNGLKGAKNFLDKVWDIYHKIEAKDCHNKDGQHKAPEGMPELLHKTIKKVTEDIENFRFNTAISQMMIFVNFLSKHKEAPKGALKKFLILLSPFAPHIAEELWQELGNKESIFKQEWSQYNPDLIKDKVIELVLQINGKVRDKIEVDAEISEAEAKDLALARPKIKKWTDGKEIIKVIFVKGKLVNIVVKL